MIIMVVVAVVVTVYTAGALSGMVGAGMGGLSTGSAVAVGAVSGAAGSAASMAAGSMMGVASFSWSGVAAGAITGAITGGLASQYGSVGNAVNGTVKAGEAVAPNLVKAAALAVANAAANYAGQKLAGMDVSFSWRSIASSAVSSVVSAKATPGMVDRLDLNAGFASDVAGGVAGGMVSAAVRSSFGQTLHQADYATVVADAFGNALGNAMVRGATMSQARPGMQSREELMATWAQEDALQRERLIAAEESSRRSGSSVSAFDGGFDGSDGARVLPTIVLAGAELTRDERQRLATTTPYHTHHVDPYAIARNGDSADQYNVVQTFWVRNNHPVSVEALPAWTMAPPAARISATEARNNNLEVAKQSAVQYWGSNVPMRMAARAGYNIVQGLSGVYGLATDLQYGRAVQGAIGYAAQNPGAVVKAAGQGLENWWSGSLVSKLEGAGTFGIELLASGGTALITRTGTGVRTLGAVVDVADEAAALRRIADLNASPQAQSLHARINARTMVSGDISPSNAIVPNGGRSAFASTESVKVSGMRAIDLGKAYEVGVRNLYGDVPFGQRQYEALVNGKWVDGVADNVLQIGGKNTAIEAKFVDDWATSLRNPASPQGVKPWAVGEQSKMVNQAMKYNAAFDQVIYHTNSVDLANYYSRAFTQAGVNNFRFVITPAVR